MKKSAWPKEFRERFLKRETELKWLHSELYHQDEKAYARFVEMLCRAYRSRPTALRRLDRKRLETPDWYRSRKLLGMQLYVGAFAGNLNGVRDRLDYIEECGVNYLHLMPLLESPAGRSDGGYAVSDFRRVQPELGTMEELAALAEDCHRRGISVCLDFVMNHTSEDHEWARRARAGEKEYQDRYFFFDSWDIPEQFEELVPQVFPTTAPGNFSWCKEAGKVVMTTFYPYQWDLNYSNPAVFEEMTENLLFLCNQGVDVIRLDAVPYIWKELGTNCRNLPQVHTLVRMIRIAGEIVCPGTILLGEVVMEPSKVVPYFGSARRPECHLLYNVTTMATTWHTVATKDVRLLRSQLDKLFSLPGEYGFLNYLRCHDDIGWGLDYAFLRNLGSEETAHKKYLNDYLTGKWPGSPARGELYNDDPRLGDARLCGTTASLCGIESARKAGDAEKLEQAINLDGMLHAYMLSLSGIPVLYSGDEIAAENDYSYHDDPEKAADSRYLHRGKMNWDAAEKRRDPESPEGRLFALLRRLETIRACHRVFDGRADAWTMELWDQSILGMGRYYEGEKLIGLYNFSAQPKRVSLRHEEGEFYDLVTGRGVNKNSIPLEPNGFRWLLCDFTADDSDKKRKLIVLDLDGAASGEEHFALPNDVLKAIRRLRGEGHKILLCTDRMPGELKKTGKVQLDGLICASGGYVRIDGETVFDYPMGARQRDLALHLLHESGVAVSLVTANGCFCDEGFPTAQAANARPLSAYRGEHVYRIDFACGDHAQLQDALRALDGEHLFSFRSDETAEGLRGSIRRSRCDKGSALLFAAEMLGIATADTIGFGLGAEALPMLMAAGTALCPADAEKALKDVCTPGCPSLDNGGIGWIADTVLSAKR